MIPLFSLALSHEYFGEHPPPDLAVVPGAATHRMASRAGIRFRDEPGGLRAWCEPDAPETLRAYARDRVEPLVLYFIVQARDPAFSNYTQPSTLSDGSLPLVTEGDLEGGPCPVSGPWPRSLEDAGPTPLTPVDLPPTSRLVIRLDFSGDSGMARLDGILEGQPWVGEVAWESRKTLWRYFIPCEAHGEELSIGDTQGEVSFSAVPGVAASGFRDHVGFISSQPLSLAHRSPGRFALMKTEQGRRRTLIKALPNASAQRLQGMEQDENYVFVSDIFIHHYIYGR